MIGYLSSYVEENLQHGRVRTKLYNSNWQKSCHNKPGPRITSLTGKNYSKM